MGASAQERPPLLSAAAIVLAAGAGRRMGADKALLELEGRTSIARVVAACRAAEVATIVVVRARGAAPLPAGLDVHVVEVEPGVEMIDSLRTGARAVGAVDAIVVWPVDTPLVLAATVLTLLTAVVRADGPDIALPIFAGRPGHPVVLRPSALARATAPDVTSLREIVRAGPVAAVAVVDPWTHRDLDTPADLDAARALLRSSSAPVLDLMRAHRSRRAFHPEPIAEELLVALVDAARHASTSSFIQAYAVVAVRDEARKAEVARLCGDYEHVRQAPVFLAICADLNKLDACCRRHGQTFDPGSTEVFLQATIDAALLGQNLLLAAEGSGLGGCMIGAARNHPVDLARLLGLPPMVYVVFGLVLGRPADDPVPRTRMPLSGVLFFERYDKATADAVLDATDAGMRAWAREVNRRAPAGTRQVHEGKGWSDRMAAIWARAKARSGPRASLRARLADLGFPLEG
ncbi:MAG: NTP transferase domain-containing protein [Phycisphaerales bacterium]|nr:NTP transferase domain-containing protein [Phycisphaerales bacterium]